MAVKVLVFYKKNVNYNLGVRMFRGDNDGKVLTNADPYVEVEADEEREFKLANKHILTQGMLVKADQPEEDFETDNSLDEEQVKELLTKVMKLNSKLPKIDSLPMLYKLLDAAKAKNAAPSTLEKIQDRIDEVEMNINNSFHQRIEMKQEE